MHIIFRSLYSITLVMSCFSAYVLIAGGDFKVDNATTLSRYLVSAVTLNDLPEIDNLLEHNKPLLTPESLSAPLIEAIQSDNEDLTIRFLQEGQFNIHRHIPTTTLSPLDFAVTKRAHRVCGALTSKYLYNDWQLDASLQNMLAVEQAYRPHAEESLSSIHEKTPSSSFVAWGIGATVVAAIGTAIAIIVRHNTHR